LEKVLSEEPDNSSKAGTGRIRKLHKTAKPHRLGARIYWGHKRVKETKVYKGKGRFRTLRKTPTYTSGISGKRGELHRGNRKKHIASRILGGGHSPGQKGSTSPRMCKKIRRFLIPAEKVGV